jgi:hypothetical protein
MARHSLASCGMINERSEISLHEVKVFRAMKAEPNRWFTNKELAVACGFSERTVRAHTLRFVKLGLLDQAEVFPAHRYKFSDKSNRRNVAYLQRLERADEVFNGVVAYGGIDLALNNASASKVFSR